MTVDSTATGKTEQKHVDERTHLKAGSREFMLSVSESRYPSTIQILGHFAWDHLPVRLQPYSRNCADLALQMVGMLPDSPELTVGLRKLLEAKDSFVRAALDAGHED